VGFSVHIETMTADATIPQTTGRTKPTILDVFAGLGGWDRGAELAGFDPQLIEGIELDPAAVQTARAAGYNRVHCNVLNLNPRTSRVSAA